MKNILSLIFLITISFFSYSPINIDTIFVVSVEQKIDYNDTTIFVKTSDTNGFICKNNYSIGDIFCYYDIKKNQYISKKDYENSLFYELYNTEYYKFFYETKSVKCTKVKKVLKDKYKQRQIESDGFNISIAPQQINDMAVFRMSSETPYKPMTSGMY